MRLLDRIAVLLFVGVIRYWRWRGRGAWVIVNRSDYPMPSRHTAPVDRAMMN